MGHKPLGAGGRTCTIDHSLMGLYFIDVEGNRGHVTEGGDVEYQGSLDVERYVEQIDEEGRESEAIVETLLFEMPEDLDVAEVGREEL